MNFEGQQLPLEIRLDEFATWQNWLSRDETRAMENWLTADVKPERGAFLWGGRGLGKSHALQACCRKLSNDALYLPLRDLQSFPADQVLSRAESASLVALDDFDSVKSKQDWHEELFTMFNRCLETRTQLIFTSNCAPAQLVDVLPDLQSRLSSLAVFQLPRFTESDIAEFLKLRIGRMGMEVSDDVIKFCAVRLPRQPRQALRFLENIDNASLAKRRAITKPFIREMGLL